MYATTMVVVGICWNSVIAHIAASTGSIDAITDALVAPIFSTPFVNSLYGISVVNTARYAPAITGFNCSCMFWFSAM